MYPIAGSSDEALSPEDFLSSPLPNIGVDLGDIESSDIPGADGSPRVPLRESGYEGEIDYRVRQLSYSSINLLHTCPRKYQLYKLRSSAKNEESPDSTITFAFGHVVGLGFQLILEGKSYEETLWGMFQLWHAPLFAEDTNRNKSFWEAATAIEMFVRIRESGKLAGYELVIYEGKPATELSFCINFPDGFRYRGFVDAVLTNRETGKVLVFESKTYGGKNAVNPAQFKNSAQGLGYSIVLDTIFPDISSYEVLYFVYQSVSRDFVPLTFPKSYLQRALWIRELLLDIESIKSYEAADVYPMHGESCYSFFRECDYFNTCTLSTDYITLPGKVGDMDTTEYQINVSLLDVLEAQLTKG